MWSDKKNKTWFILKVAVHQMTLEQCIFYFIFVIFHEKISIIVIFLLSKELIFRLNFWKNLSMDIVIKNNF